jgi:serpin B
MSDDPSVHLSDVLHKTRLEVTEEGTKAAAATVGIMMMRAMMPQPPERIVVDRPFFFAIEDARGLPVFAGRVVKPEFTGPLPPE